MMKRKTRTLFAVLGSALLLVTVLACMTVFTMADEPLTIYASDMQDRILSQTSGWEGHPPTYDIDLDGHQMGLRNDGNRLTFSKGICAHASSEIVFDIEGLGATEFSAYVGINDGTGNSYYAKYAYASFRVKADGVEVAKAGPFTIDDKAYFLKVKIPAGTKRLTLIADEETANPAAGNPPAGVGKNASDHTVWADAKFTLSADGAKGLSTVKAELSSMYITEGAPVKITVIGSALDGSAIPANELTVSYKSSNEGVAKVAADGTVTAGGKEGSADITVTVTKGDKTLSTVVTVYAVSDNSETSFPITSPEGKISMLLSLEGGKLYYSVSKGGEAVITPSTIGFKGTGFDLTGGFSYIAKSEITEVHDTYKNYSGSYAEGHDDYREQTVTFAKGSLTFAVIMRAYDDGFAFRVRMAGQDSFTVTDETTQFIMPDGSYITAMKMNGNKGHFNGETSYPTQKLSATGGQYFGAPALIQSGDTYTLLTESDAWSEDPLYCGTAFYSDGGILTAIFGTIAQPSVTVKGPFTTPWRCGVVGDLETLVESDLIDNLTPRAEGDWSWVTPGVTSWTWLSEGQGGQSNPKIIRDYIDLAAEMNWAYVLLDDGWQPGSYSAGYNGYYDWFDDIMEYANEKGVGILVWARYQDLDTPAKLARIEDWAKKGIKGLKADFFDSEQQDRLQIIKNIYEKCAECGLMVNIHGSNKPTGDRIAYPNVISREYVQGQEYGGIYTSNTTVWAYTRGVAGPSDITPKLTPTGNLTSAQQIALNVVFEGGFPCMADDSEVYRSSSIKSFFRSLPSKWDDLEFLDGGVGTYTVLARRSGSEWWVGALNNQSARTANVDLSEILGDGSYYAVIYHDGSSASEILTKTEKVTKNDKLSVKMAAGGGFVIRIFSENDLTAVQSIISSDECIQVRTDRTAASHFEILPTTAQLSDLTYTIADTSIAAVDEGGVITGLKPGVTTLTASDGSGKVTGSVEIRVYRPTGDMLNDSFLLVNENPNSDIEYPAKNQVNVSIPTGDINNDPQNMILLKETPKGDFTITVQVSGGLSRDYESIGLIAYAGKGQMVVMERRSHSGLGGNVFTLSTYQGGYTERVASDSSKNAPAWLKMEKKGNVFTGYYSYNGTTWTKISQTITSTIGSSSTLRVGIVAMSGGANASDKTASFKDFTMNGQQVPFVMTVDTTELCKLYGGDVISVAKDGTLNMPAAVKGYISSGEFEEIPVTWDTSKVNLSVLGEYTVTGKVTAGSKYAASGLTVTQTVKVLEGSPFDLTGDGILDIKDVTALLSYIANPEGVTLSRSGDITGDGVVNVKDVSRLLYSLA